MPTAPPLANPLPPAADGWALPATQIQALQASYAQPPRAYHNLSHVHEVLGHYHALARSPGWRAPREVYLALCYHDAIYVPASRANETHSADLARTHIAQYLHGQGINADRVAELILLTAKHGELQPAAVDPEAAQFLDCDMAILGADPARFDAYDQAIALEYRGVVPDFVLRFKRRQFLRALLAKPRIYLSEAGHARWDAQARANLRRALQ